MPVKDAEAYRRQLEALIAEGLGITEIRKTLGIGYAAIYDAIRLWGLPKPVDRRWRHHGRLTISADPSPRAARPLRAR